MESEWQSIETATKGVPAERTRLFSWLTTGGSGLVSGYDRYDQLLGRRQAPSPRPRAKSAKTAAIGTSNYSGR
jgi:hypothetical protein